MPAKNAVAKDWSSWLPSFDGRTYSLYPAGNKPAGFQTNPTIITTDLHGITLVNNYNGKGSWFKIFGYGYGNFTLLGQSGGARVFLRDPLGDNAWHEVDVYVSVGLSKTYTKNQALVITVQAGSLHGYSPAAGHSLDLKITVNGTDSNILTAQVVNMGARHFYYAATTGNDVTGVVDDPTHPYRYVQNASGGTYLGIWAVWSPGDTIVVRGGTGITWSDQLASCNTRWMQFPWGPAFPVTTGSNPTGAAGTGYYTFYAYPGEDVHGSFATGGGFQGCDSARAQAGSGKYVQISGFRIDILGGAARDAGPVNLQSGGDHWRIFDNECGPWVAGSSTVLNSSAIGGEGVSDFVGFNHIHGIQGLSDLQNHGAYFGGVAGGTGYNAATQNLWFCYNWVHDCTGGSNFQLYWQGGNSAYMTGNVVAHNWFENSAKYTINIGESNVTCQVYDNIAIGAGLSTLRVACPTGQALDVRIEFNTFYNWNSSNNLSTGEDAVLQDGFTDGGTIKINHNIFSTGTHTGITLGWYVNNGASDTNLTMSQNAYWDSSGVLTGSAAKDASPITTDPKFTDVTTSNFTLATGSSCIDASTTTESLSPADDFFGITRPVGAHRDVGACEGVGT